MKRTIIHICLILMLVCHIQLTAQTVKVSIDPKITYQYIEGFGACVIDFTDPPAFFNDPKLYDLAVNDLGMSMLRMSFPQEIEEMNDNEDPDHFNWQAFNMHYLERRMKIALEFKKRGVDRFIFSTWSPSEFIKTNRSTVQGGHVRMDLYDEYAENIAACIIAVKQNWGIDVGAFSIQNELLFIEPYKSCIYNPYTAREAVRALMRKFEKEGINCRIQLPEDMMFFNRMYNYILPTINDPETKNFIGDFCTHRQQEWDEVVKWKNATAPLNRQTWMTETSGHQATWDGALKLANDMYDYLVGGNMSAWLYWQISDNPSSSEYALMNGTEPNPKYYASKHFYRWVRPGAKRIEGLSSHPNLLVSAFKHEQEGTLTLVLINRDDHELEIQLDIQNEKQGTFEAYRSGANEKCISLGKLTRSTIKIPAKHIVTLYRKGGKATTAKSDKWPESCSLRLAKGEKLGSFEAISPNADGEVGNVVRYRSLERIQEFFKDKDIDTESGNGWTALYWAIVAGKTDVIEWLLQQGANPAHQAKDGWTPLHTAAAAFTGEKNSEGVNKSKYDVFRLILEASPTVKVYTKEGFSPLHVAVMNEHVAWMQKEEEGYLRISDLLKAGLDPNEPDNMGRTPLHWAAWQGATNSLSVTDDMVLALLQADADVLRKDINGRTPLHYASEMGYISIVATLLYHGADPYQKDNDGHTSLDLAKNRQLSDVEELLLGHIPAPNISLDELEKVGTDYLGAELIRAVRAGQVNEVEYLLEKGADVWYRDSDGFRAYDRARDNNNKTLMDLLKKYE